MVKLPKSGDETAELIYSHYENVNDDWRRPHLGASLIGHHCNRFLWYSFRWCAEKKFHGRMLRLFKRGDIEEDWVVADLKAIGVELDANDPDTGEQWRISWFGGHFGGSCDGLGKGFAGAPKSLHVFECKTMNTKWFKKLLKELVEKAKPEHYAQMQTYMHGFRKKGIKVSRAFYVAVCKETDEIYTERVKYNKEFAEAIVNKAELVIRSDVPLTKINENPSWYQCNYCDYKSICHFERVEDLERNCRTCMSSTPLPDGSWTCEFLNTNITTEKQREGCDKHLFIPSLLPWEAVDADEVNRAIYYTDRNGIKFVDSNLQLTTQEGGRDD